MIFSSILLYFYIADKKYIDENINSNKDEYVTRNEYYYFLKKSFEQQKKSALISRFAYGDFMTYGSNLLLNEDFIINDAKTENMLWT